jgi:hypothetical protein
MAMYSKKLKLILCFNEILFHFLFQIHMKQSSPGSSLLPLTKKSPQHQTRMALDLSHVPSITPQRTQVCVFCVIENFFFKFFY